MGSSSGPINFSDVQLTEARLLTRRQTEVRRTFQLTTVKYQLTTAYCFCFTPDNLR
jgi:ABC-type branched-subunit amino acid transport system ATPase component